MKWTIQAFLFRFIIIYSYYLVILWKTLQRDQWQNPSHSILTVSFGKLHACILRRGPRKGFSSALAVYRGIVMGVV